MRPLFENFDPASVGSYWNAGMDILGLPGDLTRGALSSIPAMFGRGKSHFGERMSGEEFAQNLGWQEPGALGSMALSMATDPLAVLPLVGPALRLARGVGGAASAARGVEAATPFLKSAKFAYGAPLMGAAIEDANREVGSPIADALATGLMVSPLAVHAPGMLKSAAGRLGRMAGFGGDAEALARGIQPEAPQRPVPEGGWYGERTPADWDALAGGMREEPGYMPKGAPDATGYSVHDPQSGFPIGKYGTLQEAEAAAQKYGGAISPLTHPDDIAALSHQMADATAQRATPSTLAPPAPPFPKVPDQGGFPMGGGPEANAAIMSNPYGRPGGPLGPLSDAVHALMPGIFGKTATSGGLGGAGAAAKPDPRLGPALEAINRNIAAIVGSPMPAQATAQARAKLGIANHADFMREMQAAKANNDVEAMRRINLALHQASAAEGLAAGIAPAPQAATATPAAPAAPAGVPAKPTTAPTPVTSGGMSDAEIISGLRSMYSEKEIPDAAIQRILASPTNRAMVEEKLRGLVPQTERPLITDVNTNRLDPELGYRSDPAGWDQAIWDYYLRNPDQLEGVNVGHPELATTDFGDLGGESQASFLQRMAQQIQQQRLAPGGQFAPELKATLEPSLEQPNPYLGLAKMRPPEQRFRGPAGPETAISQPPGNPNMAELAELRSPPKSMQTRFWPSVAQNIEAAAEQPLTKRAWVEENAPQFGPRKPAELIDLEQAGLRLRPKWAPPEIAGTLPTLADDIARHPELFGLPPNQSAVAPDVLTPLAAERLASQLAPRSDVMMGPTSKPATKTNPPAEPSGMPYAGPGVRKYPPMEQMQTVRGAIKNPRQALKNVFADTGAKWETLVKPLQEQPLALRLMGYLQTVKDDPDILRQVGVTGSTNAFLKNAANMIASKDADGMRDLVRIFQQETHPSLYPGYRGAPRASEVEARKELGLPKPSSRSRIRPGSYAYLSEDLASQDLQRALEDATVRAGREHHPRVNPSTEDMVEALFDPESEMYNYAAAQKLYNDPKRGLMQWQVSGSKQREIGKQKGNLLQRSQANLQRAIDSIDPETGESPLLDRLGIGGDPQEYVEAMREAIAGKNKTLMRRMDERFKELVPDVYPVPSRRQSLQPSQKGLNITGGRRFAGSDTGDIRQEINQAMDIAAGEESVKRVAPSRELLSAEPDPVEAAMMKEQIKALLTGVDPETVTPEDMADIRGMVNWMAQDRGVRRSIIGGSAPRNPRLPESATNPMQRRVINLIPDPTEVSYDKLPVEDRQKLEHISRLFTQATENAPPATEMMARNYAERLAKGVTGELEPSEATRLPLAHAGVDIQVPAGMQQLPIDLTPEMMEKIRALPPEQRSRMIQSIRQIVSQPEYETARVGMTPGYDELEAWRQRMLEGQPSRLPAEPTATLAPGIPKPLPIPPSPEPVVGQSPMSQYMGNQPQALENLGYQPPSLDPALLDRLMKATGLSPGMILAMLLGGGMGGGLGLAQGLVGNEYAQGG